MRTNSLLQLGAHSDILRISNHASDPLMAAGSESQLEQGQPLQKIATIQMSRMLVHIASSSARRLFSLLSEELRLLKRWSGLIPIKNDNVKDLR